MSAEENVKPPDERIDVGGGTVVYTQPRQVGYTLRREEFDLLCEGETDAEDKRWRDVCLGIAITCVIGLLSVIVAVDWTQDARRSWRVWVVTVILVAGSVAAFVLFFYLLRRVKSHKESSGYQRTKERIRKFFEQQRD